MTAATKAVAKAEPLVLTFAFERDTKNMIRFQEQGVPDDQRPTIGTLYITKAACAKLGRFKTISVTVEATG